jgi:radical SAM protein with 4Fe4S-binding SPASM domain
MKIFKIFDVLPQIPNILFRGRFKFKFEHLPFEARGITWKKKLNFLIAGLNQYFLPSRPLGHPAIAQVEPSNICNLECPLCLTASVTQSRPPALLPFDTFKKLIDDVGDYLLLLILWNWGEPFLNPDIFKMIAYAATKNIIVYTSTNGNVAFDGNTADQLVESGLAGLVFGVDGATPETYSSYRKKGDLERVKENIRTLVRAKKRKNSPTPIISFRFVAMQHNEAELPLAEKMAGELGADFFSIKTVDMPPVLGKNLDQTYRPRKKKYRRYDYIDNTYVREKKPFQCMRPWKRVTLDSSGEIISCEYDYKNLHSFGNIGNGQLPMEVWKNKHSREFRRLFHKGHNAFYHCKSCTYKDLRMEDCIFGAYPTRSGGSGVHNR